MVLYCVTREPYSVVHVDRSIVVVSKATGIPTQPDPSGAASLPQMLQPEFGDELRVVHRIDRPASGLVVLARTQQAAAALSDIFRSGRAVRTGTRRPTTTTCAR